MNLTAVGIYDPLSNREPKPGADRLHLFLFAAIKPVEDMRYLAFGYADAGVAYSHADNRFVHGRSYCHHPTARSIFYRIVEEVRKGLLQKIHISEKLNRRLSVLLTHGYNTSFSLEPEAVHN